MLRIVAKADVRILRVLSFQNVDLIMRAILVNFNVPTFYAVELFELVSCIGSAGSCFGSTNIYRRETSEANYRRYPMYTRSRI